MILLVFQRMDGRDRESKGRKINVPATEIVEARNKCPTKAVLVGMERRAGFWVMCPELTGPLRIAWITGQLWLPVSVPVRLCLKEGSQWWWSWTPPAFCVPALTAGLFWRLNLFLLLLGLLPGMLSSRSLYSWILLLLVLLELNYVLPKFTSWSPDTYYLQMWLYLETELLQMQIIKLEWGHTGLGSALNAI